jgi:hypothetical protein
LELKCKSYERNKKTEKEKKKKKKDLSDRTESGPARRTVRPIRAIARRGRQ